MHLSLKLFVIAFLALSGCTPAIPQLDIQPIPFGETNTAVKAFSDSCLKTFPKFDGFGSQIKAKGLESTKYKGFTFFHLPGTLRVATFNEKIDGVGVCGVGFIGSANIPAVSQKFLSEAKRKTGGKAETVLPEKKIGVQDNIREAYALGNNSVYAHAVEPKGQYILHMFIVTQPVPDPFALDL